MTPENLVRDPLYQINLILWMMTPATDVEIEPVFHRAGFDVFQIEGELRLPLKLAADLKQKNIEASSAVVPDLLLRGKQKEYLIIECKAALFGPGDGGPQRQARALLLQTPDVMTESLSLQGGAIARTHLLYLTAHDPRHDQITALATLDEELRAVGAATAPVGLLALKVASDTIVIDATALPPSLQTYAKNGSLAIQRLPAKDTDPRPLYRIAWMPGSEKNEDSYNQEQFAKRILASAAMQIAKARLYKSKAVKVQIEPILEEATSGFFKKWKKREETKLVRARALEILRIQLGKVRQALPTADGQAIEIYIPDRAAQEEIVEKLRDWSTTDYPLDVQQLLFNADNSRTLNRSSAQKKVPARSPQKH